MLKKYLWKKAIKKACSATEGVEDTFANYLTKSPGVKRYFRLLTKANTSNNLYRNFVITIAFELYTINEQITKIAQNHPAIVKTSSSEAPCWISR